MPWRSSSVTAAAPLIALAVAHGAVIAAPADDGAQTSTHSTTQDRGEGGEHATDAE